MRKNLLPIKDLITFVTSKQCGLECALEKLDLVDTPKVAAQQVHGNRIAIVTETTTQIVPEVDGLITNLSGVLLQIKAADCMPILIYHEKPYIVAALHSGRIGTETNILGEAFKIIKKTYGVTEDFKIWFGPAICESCYQIDRELDLHYNMLKKNKKHLEESGITYELFIDERCTSCNNDKLYSWRKEKEFSRIFSAIGTI
ncbi:MAG: YfiH family protein [Planctomycetota bacterium]|jgi:YfiH family protein